LTLKYINCGLCNSREEDNITSLEYRVQKIVLKCNNSNVLDMIKKIKNKVQTISFNPADSSGKVREKKEQYLKSFTGMLVEEICFRILDKYNTNKNIEIVSDTSNSSIDQVDLKIVKNIRDTNGEFSKVYEVEVRSSFPFKKIEDIVCNEFDVLGAYINDVKVSEKEKDFYLRFLFELDYRRENYHKFGTNNEKINYNKTTINTLLNDYFDDSFKLKKDLVIYFVGGATREMMNDKSISYIGDMRSETFNQDKGGKYKKIKLSNAIDSISILRLMLGSIDSELIDKK